MVTMSICVVLLLLGIVATVAWGRQEFTVPEFGPPDSTDSVGWAARKYVWHLMVAVVSGAIAGLLVAGAGGRLAMRLLAETAGEAAAGRATEGNEIVGKITLHGSAELVMFGVIIGVATGLIYVLIRPWLPAGRWGGLVFGLLMVAVATHGMPLDPANPDFDIVGPGWVSVAVFAALALLHGMLVAALAGRYTHAAPVMARTRRSALGHLPMLAVLPVFPVYLGFAVGAGGYVLLTRPAFAPLLRAVHSRPALLGGRALLALLLLAAVPGSISTVVDIAGWPDPSSS